MQWHLAAADETSETDEMVAATTHHARNHDSLPLELLTQLLHHPADTLKIEARNQGNQDCRQATLEVTQSNNSSHQGRGWE